MRIAVVNYGVGNLYSVTSALRKLGAEASVVRTLDPGSYDGIVLPGVGNFEAGSRELEASVLKFQLIDAARAGIPILGICLGLQLMFERSEEGPGRGLSLIRGEVLKLRVPMKLPHMGWNTLEVIRPSELLEGVESGEWAYFVHSYYPSPEDRNLVLCETEYHVRFPSVIGNRNLYGTQFHPEKSGETGRKILRNFVRSCVRK